MIVYVAVGRNISYQKKARVLEEIRVRNLLKEIKPPVNTLPIFEHPHWNCQNQRCLEKGSIFLK